MTSASHASALPGSAAPLTLTAIVAATMTNGLGVAGTLPWRLKGEMTYFRAATTSLAPADRAKNAMNAVIMGRKTWESIPVKFRPLKDRINIVISRTQSAEDLEISGKSDAWLFPSLEQAIAFLKERRDSGASRRASLSRAFIIGGAQLYSDCLSKAAMEQQTSDVVDRLLVTRILTPDFPDCDAFLPEIRDPQQMDEDLELCKRASDADVDQPSAPQALQQRRWQKATSEQLNDYLAIQDGIMPNDGLEGDIVKENGVSYQFQMWSRAAQT